MVGATLRHTANPTMLDAGYKHNVIPQKATAYVDGRFLPNAEKQFLDQLAELVGPDIAIEMIHSDIGYETSFDGALVDAMKSALLAEDPEARAVPYCLSGGTDAKSFSTLGMRCFGFSPLKLPAVCTTIGSGEDGCTIASSPSSTTLNGTSASPCSQRRSPAAAVRS